MAISSIKTKQTAAKPCQFTNAAATQSTTQQTILDFQTVMSQLTMITQLTEQVSELQKTHKKINAKLSCLTELFMADAPQHKTPSPSKQKAGGLQGDAGMQT